MRNTTSKLRNINVESKPYPLSIILTLTPSTTKFRIYILKTPFQYNWFLRPTYSYQRTWQNYFLQARFYITLNFQEVQ